MLYRVLIGIDRQIFNALKFPSSAIAAHIISFYADRLEEQKSRQDLNWNKNVKFYVSMNMKWLSWNLRKEIIRINEFVLFFYQSQNICNFLNTICIESYDH